MILGQAGYSYELSGVGSAGNNEQWILFLLYSYKEDFHIRNYGELYADLRNKGNICDKAMTSNSVLRAL